MSTENDILKILQKTPQETPFKLDKGSSFGGLHAERLAETVAEKSTCFCF